MSNRKNTNEDIKECTYYVDGMHCAACEVLIEKQILKEDGVESVDASTGNGEVTVNYIGDTPDPDKLNSIFQEDGYSFSQEEHLSDNKQKGLFTISEEGKLLMNVDTNKVFTSFLSALVVLGVISFILFGGARISSLVSVNANSSLPVLFVFGLLAGSSSCAALVGGIVLSMSKQWSEVHSNSTSFVKKSEPHLLFNLGRILSFLIVGIFLGAVGSVIGNIFEETSIFSYLTVVISIIMILLGLQMLGVKALQGFQIKMPKAATRYAADESNFNGRTMPFMMGVLSFILPCGFTITAYSVALLSGSPIQGGLIMLSFVLGTTPTLLAIGLSSVKFTQKPHISASFLKVAGMLVLFFGLYNINAQMNVLGFPSLSDISLDSSVEVSNSNLPPIVGGKQILKMDAGASGYVPNVLNVRVGTPVRWEISDIGTSGCTNSVISKSLFDGRINLTPGETAVKEFTPTEVGRYKFSCWMGMVSGIINVVEEDGSIPADLAGNDSEIEPSGAVGCGGGDGSGDGGCGCGG